MLSCSANSRQFAFSLQLEKMEAFVMEKTGFARIPKEEIGHFSSHCCYLYLCTQVCTLWLVVYTCDHVCCSGGLWRKTSTKTRRRWMKRWRPLPTCGLATRPQKWPSYASSSSLLFSSFFSLHYWSCWLNSNLYCSIHNISSRLRDKMNKLVKKSTGCVLQVG